MIALEMTKERLEGVRKLAEETLSGAPDYQSYVVTWLNEAEDELRRNEHYRPSEGHISIILARCLDATK